MTLKRKPMVRKRLVRKKPFKRKMGQNKLRVIKEARKGLKRKIRASGGIPAWLRCVPEGLHGSGSLEKRLWRLTSDFCRIRDWHKWEGKCVATGKYLESWNHGQGGHFKSWPKCNNMYKFDPRNIHLQGAQSNSWGDKDDWKYFEEELTRRYGIEHVRNIEVQNANNPPKRTKEMVMTYIEARIEDITALPQKPPYWNRLMKLRATTLLEELQVKK